MCLGQHMLVKLGLNITTPYTQHNNLKAYLFILVLTTFKDLDVGLTRF